METRSFRRGFTLIELMIVVAIVGILAAIAIPNFLRLQAKSRQAEAKQNLGGIYSANTAFFAEHNFYSGEFTGVYGISWTPAGATRYAYALSNAAGAGVRMNSIGNAVPNPPGCGAAVGPQALTFTACAAGNIAIAVARPDDWWIINDVRVLRNTQTGY